jgi:hypothetical protein
MVQYFRDLWARHSEMLSSFINLVGECGHTKATRSVKIKLKPWHWDSVHQTTFDNVKKAITKDVVLSYPEYSQEFDVYKDSSLQKIVSKM